MLARGLVREEARSRELREYTIEDEEIRSDAASTVFEFPTGIPQCQNSAANDNVSLSLVGNTTSNLWDRD